MSYGPVEYAAAGMRPQVKCTGCGGALLHITETCACGGHAAGYREWKAAVSGSSRRSGGLTAVEAVRQLEERRARWEAREDEEYWRAYVAAGIALRRPDPWGCMRTLLRRQKRWLEQEYGR